MKIKILKEEVASQIAAGEVVERPASVVKELLENAIDAGAKRIMIQVEEAGKKLIEVSDNGTGISVPDLDLAIARHATSKLQTAEELFHIRTLGFRGEALASIGSVSRMTIVSRVAESQNGGEVVVEGGKTLNHTPAGATTGTTVRVEHLFYNTPARLKFLKRDQTEKQQINGLVTRYALAYPHKAIHLIEDGKPVLKSSGSGNAREILAQLYGIDLAKKLLEVVYEDENLRITGYISPISITRSNRRDITFFVNGRWVQDSSMSAALVKAYQTYLMVGRFPLAALFVTIQPEDVDVNVHPAKAEVRFKQPDLIFNAIQHAVRRALLAYSPIPQLSGPSWRPEFYGQNTTHNWKSPEISWEEHSQNQTQYPMNSDTPEAIHNGIGGIPLLRLIGQIGATFLVAEGPDGLYLVDQHAAHERVLFEKMMFKKGAIPSQALLEPVVMLFPPQEAMLIGENLTTLNRIGFQIEEFGTNSYRLSSIPAIFKSGDIQSAIRSVVEDFEEDETPLQGKLEELLTARICKRMAVKGGQVLSSEEQLALLRDLEKCEAPRTCPHGRPTMIHLSVDLLERQFGRRGPRTF